MIPRRSFITGLISLVAAPAIVRVGSIMPVRVMEPDPAAILARFIDMRAWQQVAWNSDWHDVQSYVVGDEIQHYRLDAREFYR